MDETLRSLIEDFKNKKVLVIGDAILDTYIKGAPSKVCREAPVLVFNAQHYEYQCGGAANTAINVSALGAETYFLTVIGKDGNGRELIDELKKNKVHTEFILKDKERVTLAKKRVMAASNILLRIDEGSESVISDACQEEMVEQVNELFDKVDAIILSDYGYGIINPSLLEAIKVLNKKENKPIVVDARDLSKLSMIHPTCVKPNYQEAIDLLDLKPEVGAKRIAQIEAVQEKLFKVTNAKQVVVTLDADGVLSFEKGQTPLIIPCKPVDNKNAIGAGDTFISALTLALAANASSVKAVEVASSAAAIVVQKEGTAQCTNHELQLSFNLMPKYLPTLSSLSIIIDRLKKEGKKIVFTNGCFDILHKGHVALLNEAKKEGDVLIVGINSDKSVQKVKGKDRPINVFEDRLAVLAGLQSVDYLIAFDEDSPVQLIKTVHPDIFVKGSTYSTEDAIRETPLLKKLNCRIKIVPIVEDHSTTFIIGKIIDNYEGLKLSA